MNMLRTNNGILYLICTAALVSLLTAATHSFKEIRGFGSKLRGVSTKLHFITSPHIIANVSMGDDEIKKIDGTEIVFTNDEITFRDSTCVLDRTSGQTVNTLDYFISNYKVLKNPNDINSSASRTLLPEEVGIKSTTVIVNVADCGDSSMKIFNDFAAKRIFIEYKNSFFFVPG